MEGGDDEDLLKEAEERKEMMDGDLSESSVMMVDLCSDWTKCCPVIKDCG